MIAGACVSSPALAETASTDMPVSGDIRYRCDVTATPMHFVVANPGANTNVDATASILLRCTRFTFFDVTIDYGQNANGRQRRMANANGDLLDYDLYLNAARTRPWGTGPDRVRFFASGPAQGTFTVYGRIPSVSAFQTGGEYRDVVTINVNF